MVETIVDPTVPAPDDTSLLPQADPVEQPIPQQPYLEGVPQTMPEGMGREFFNEQTASQQMSMKNIWRNQLDQSAVNSVIEWASDAPDAIEEYLDKGSAELEPLREELTAGIPLHLQDNIMSSRTVVGARARADRIREDLRVQGRLGQQVGLSANAMRLASGLLDADLPLMFATGGTVAAAKTAARTAQLASTVGVGVKGQRIAGDIAVGLSGGALAGVITGGSAAAVRDDYDANSMMMMVAAAAATGGVLNTAVGRVMPDNHLWTQADALTAQRAFQDMEVSLERGILDPDSAFNSKGMPMDDVTVSPNAPRMFNEVGEEVPLNTGVGAEDLGTAGREITDDTLGLAAVGAPGAIVETSVRMQNWKADYDFDALYRADTASPTVKLLVGGSDAQIRIPTTETSIPIGQIAGAAFTMASRDFTKLVHSPSASANFVAAEILESSSGLVRRGSSSSVLREMFHSGAMIHSAQPLQNARSQYMKANGLSHWRISSHRQFSRDLRLAMDEYRQTGKIREGYEEVINGIDGTHAAILGRMKGLDENTSVRGAAEIDHQPGWFRHDWEPQNFRRITNEAGEDALVQAFRTGYMRRAGLDSDLAEKVAKAVVRRFNDRSIGVGAVDSRALDVDSRTGIETMLEAANVPRGEIDSIMRRLEVNSQERATKGFLRNRVEVDINTPIPGTNYRIVDLMSDDIERSIQRYVGDASGAAALAHKGIRDQADINNLKDTIMLEQTALGDTSLTRQQLDAIFSQFGGGQHGGLMMGHAVEGVSPLTSMLTKATRASLLQRVGLTQLMDTANIVVANGVKNAMEPVMARLGFDKVGRMSKEQLTRLHDELESIGQISGQDHILFSPHLAIDEAQLAENLAVQTMQSGLNTVERATNFASGQIHVTRAQQLVASAATTTNVMRNLAGMETNLTDRALRDIGLEPHIISDITDMIEQGIIKVDGGKVELNVAQWSPETQLEFGAAITRSTHQQVQKGLIGETSVWMNHDVGKLLSALKSFGMVATQKQMARNIMIGGKPQFLHAAAWQMGFAFSVLTLSQAISGTQMSATDRARLAVAYTPSMGTVPMLVDPMTTMLGFDDLNFSPYGRYSSFGDTPVFEQAQKLQRAPGAIASMISGNGDYDDKTNAQAMFMMNWYGMKRVWESM